MRGPYAGGPLAELFALVLQPSAEGVAFTASTKEEHAR